MAKIKKRKNKNLPFLLLLLILTVCVFIYGLKHIGLFARGAFDDEINAAGVMFGVDPLLVEAVIKRESNMNPDAVSNKGAVGLMQIMPKTAGEISGQIAFPGYSEDSLKDPAVNTVFGTFYLAKLLAYYDNNLILALAAYNAGIGNVDKWIARDKEIAKKISRIPFKETKRHVRAIIITYNFYKGAEKLKTVLKIRKK